MFEHTLVHYYAYPLRPPHKKGGCPKMFEHPITPSTETTL